MKLYPYFLLSYGAAVFVHFMIYMGNLNFTEAPPIEIVIIENICKVFYMILLPFVLCFAEESEDANG